ncbi:hypothetical protein TWF730_006994 [Orbilia blumenaviensis]|uniref:Manganese lipoxygenase n=1 Tax=Orbilia blumenaviensis TaxID=1796055 RepID=A0AAV9VGF0_9PEZI
MPFLHVLSRIIASKARKMKPAYVFTACIASVATVPIRRAELQDDLFSLPGPLHFVRDFDIKAKRLVFVYGPGAGGGPPSPAGVLGQARVEIDTLITNVELNAQVAIDVKGKDAAVANISKLGGLKTLDDYTKLYDHWKETTAPTGVSPGSLKNYRQDLFFSMQRLSTNPYALQRLFPGEDLPFIVDDTIAVGLTGRKLTKLLSEGRLFYVDHSGIRHFETEKPANYAGGCDAYFYISPSDGQFLPLAIRANYDSDLIYSPYDTPDDWMLAKMMFNADDLFMAQFYHFSGSHYVTEAVYQAAIRTLSEEHPILAVLKRLMYGAFGIRPLAVSVLFAKGGVIDQHFGYSGRAAEVYSDYLYTSGIAGAVQGNYFKTNLRGRGLIDFEEGPPLKHFPFYEDALPIWNAMRTFMTVLVNTYYPDNNAITNDDELMQWVDEANGPAKVVDFPTREIMTTRAKLIDLLTHMAHLVSTAHHVVNTNAIITIGGVLPLNPGGLSRPIPTTKGVKNIVKYLPPADKSIAYILSTGLFARPLLAGTDRTLVHMFDDPQMLKRMPPAVTTANKFFKAAMRARSNIVKHRDFGKDGLSQGMPFIWKTLDPDVMPWSLSV